MSEKKLTFGCDPETVLCVGHADNVTEAIRQSLMSSRHVGSCIVANQSPPSISPELFARMVIPFHIEPHRPYEKYPFQNHMQRWTKGR